MELTNLELKFAKADWSKQASIEKRLSPYKVVDNFKLATMLDPRFKLLVAEWRVLWCPWSADFPGGAFVAKISSRVYGIEISLFGIDKFDVELTKWN